MLNYNIYYFRYILNSDFIVINCTFLPQKIAFDIFIFLLLNLLFFASKKFSRIIFWKYLIVEYISYNLNFFDRDATLRK